VCFFTRFRSALLAEKVGGSGVSARPLGTNPLRQQSATKPHNAEAPPVDMHSRPTHQIARNPMNGYVLAVFDGPFARPPRLSAPGPAPVPD
jgi:hypothetical protein